MSSQTYTITNNTGAYLYCVSSNDGSSTNTWFGTSSNQVANLTGGEGTYWVYNFFQSYGVSPNSNVYYGTVVFIIKMSGIYPYFGQQGNTDGANAPTLYDQGIDSNGSTHQNTYTFNWKNNINFDPYTSANFSTGNSYNTSFTPSLNPNYNTSGLIGLNADFAYFPNGSGTNFSLDLISGTSWGSSTNNTYLLTNNPNTTNENYVWFPELSARGNYTISNQTEITQVAPIQNRSCWSRAYGALTQNTSTNSLDSEEIAATYGIGASSGTWSIDFQSGDQTFSLCESFYLTERPYLSPQSTANYGDGQSPTFYLEIDGIETFWQNNASGYPTNSCIQGGAFVGNLNGGNVYTGGFPIPVVKSGTYNNVWVRSEVTLTNSDIIFSYFNLDENGNNPTAITLSNGKTSWSACQDSTNQAFCPALKNYLTSKTVRLYPYISTWTPVGTNCQNNTTTKYKNFNYKSN